MKLMIVLLFCFSYFVITGSDNINSTNESCKGEIGSLLCQLNKVIKSKRENASISTEETKQTIESLKARFDDLVAVLTSSDEQLRNETLRNRGIIQRLGNRMIGDVGNLNDRIDSNENATKRLIEAKVDDVEEMSTREDSKLHSDLTQQNLALGAQLRLEMAVERNRSYLMNKLLDEKISLLRTENEHLRSQLQSQSRLTEDRVRRELENYTQIIRQDKQLIVDQLSKFINTTKYDNGTSVWPKGGYCIMSNGDCPQGFEKLQGFFRVARMQGSSARSGKMGDTEIKKSNYAARVAVEFHLSTCCKK